MFCFVRQLPALRLGHRRNHFVQRGSDDADTTRGYVNTSVILRDDRFSACGKVYRYWFSTSQIIHQHVDHGRGVKGKELRDDEVADDGDAEGLAVRQLNGVVEFAMPALVRHHRRCMNALCSAILRAGGALRDFDDMKIAANFDVIE
jgi:hypothetical protein